MSNSPNYRQKCQLNEEANAASERSRLAWVNYDVTGDPKDREKAEALERITAVATRTAGVYEREYNAMIYYDAMIRPGGPLNG